MVIGTSVVVVMMKALGLEVVTFLTWCEDLGCLKFKMPRKKIHHVNVIINLKT